MAATSQAAHSLGKADSGSFLEVPAGKANQGIDYIRLQLVQKLASPPIGAISFAIAAELIPCLHPTHKLSILWPNCSNHDYPGLGTLRLGHFCNVAGWPSVDFALHRLPEARLPVSWHRPIAQPPSNSTLQAASRAAETSNNAPAATADLVTESTTDPKATTVEDEAPEFEQWRPLLAMGVGVFVVLSLMIGLKVHAFVALILGALTISCFIPLDIIGFVKTPEPHVDSRTKLARQCKSSIASPVPSATR